MKTELAYTPRQDLPESPPETAFAGWTNRNHIHIGFNTVIAATRMRPDRERDALRWMANYAQREQLTADALTAHLDADRATIRAALTNPEAEVSRLVRKIESMRSVLDANLPVPVDTAQHLKVATACRFALEEGALVEFIDKTRTGKTETGDWFHLRNLHQAIYFVCPATESYSDFIYAVARAAGVSVGNGKRVTQIEAQLRKMFGRSGIRFLICDEGHNLWPSDVELKPKRIEFLRTLWDENKRQVGIVVLSTPQALVSANQALSKSKRWSPGQWEGRIVRFWGPDKASDDDIRKVAKRHCPEADAAILGELVRFTKVAPGFYGTMVNCILRARFEARDAGQKLALCHIMDAEDESIRGTELGEAVKKAAARN